LKKTARCLPPSPDTCSTASRRFYLETSNYRHPQAVVGQGTAGRFVDAAYAAGIRVVAWYLPSFASPSRDLAHVLGALRFRTASGQRFDSVALDIEASVVHPVALRNARLLALAASLRRAAGAGYPLGAIIPSPVGWRGRPHSGSNLTRGARRRLDALRRASRQT
jgi:hypothetical protein